MDLNIQLFTGNCIKPVGLDTRSIISKLDRINKIEKSFSQVRVLKDVNFSVQAIPPNVVWGIVI